MSLEGQKAPDFTLEGSDGKQHSLEQYAGKTVVMFLSPGQHPRLHQGSLRLSG